MKQIRIGLLSILLGCVIISIPFLKENWEDRKQQQIVKLWEQEIQQLEEVTEEGTIEETAEKQDRADENAIGILKIPKINLKQPILENATKENLAVSIATVEPTARPGEGGNVAIAGHNSRTSGRHFNRLEEVEKGDEIILEMEKAEFTYEVTDTFIVNAEDVWVLEHTIAGEEITLITCHYPKEGETQRFVVQGLRK